MIFIIESQVRYIVDAVRTMRRHGLGASSRPRRTGTVDCGRAGADEAHRLDDGRLRELVPRQHGHNTTLWPGQTFAFRSHLSPFDADTYDVSPMVELTVAEEALA